MAQNVIPSVPTVPTKEWQVQNLSDTSAAVWICGYLLARFQRLSEIKDPLEWATDEFIHASEMQREVHQVLCDELGTTEDPLPMPDRLWLAGAFKLWFPQGQVGLGNLKAALLSFGEQCKAAEDALA